jgi:hypothetical protein
MFYLPLEKLIQGSQSISNSNDNLTVAPQTRLPEIQVTPVEDPARARGVR